MYLYLADPFCWCTCKWLTAVSDVPVPGWPLLLMYMCLANRCWRCICTWLTHFVDKHTWLTAMVDVPVPGWPILLMYMYLANRYGRCTCTWLTHFVDIHVPGSPLWLMYLSQNRCAFFIAPIPKFLEDFNETINHWFWRNRHQGPYPFGSG